MEACTYPVTGLGCVSRLYSDLAVIDLSPDGATVIELTPGVTIEDLRRLTGVPLAYAAVIHRTSMATLA